MEYKDYYMILGVDRTATPAEIKKAFRRLARQHHPDAKGGADRAAEARFKEINEANAVLADPQKRRQYDTLGANWEAFARSGGPGAGGDPFAPGGPFASFRTAGGPGVRFEFGDDDGSGFSDFFRMFFSGFGSPTTGGADRAGRATRPARGAGPAGRGRPTSAGSTREPMFEDLAFELREGGAATATQARPRSRPARRDLAAEIGLEEAFHGASRLVEIDGRRLEVTIPRGVDTGSRIRLRGTGRDDPEGGDVHLRIRVRPHPVFNRSGVNLTRELPITLREALLGGQVPVTTLKGRVLLTLPPGTQTDRTFRLSGQGMPKLGKSSEYGDLYVKVRVVLPQNLDDRARAAAEKFLELVNQPDPRAG